ncbi:MAG: valine--tRNA ligase [Planctomycetota bacterium]
MPGELPKQYDPLGIEKEVSAGWLKSNAFGALPDAREDRYVIMMPLPNVTGALHMGHAMDNVMQDLLIRWHRMRGDNTLWMAGTDHAGIGTQAVVEKRLLELEGKTRHDLGREALVQRIWEWKDQCQRRIVAQLQTMGCSCDWNRQRFTMDPVCTRAVFWTFYRMFRDGLIFRGHRLVNWDCHLQTAVSDDEVVHESVAGHFWHLRYPIIDPEEGEPTHVVVATTRPETMLGDTAVACHPDPHGALERIIQKTREKLAGASARDQVTLQEELERLEKRRETHLPHLKKLVEMSHAGRQVKLPFLERSIPLICDDWAKPELGSGCVKITPGHDPNDYEVWGRHQDEISIINILNPDGTLNDNAGPYAGFDRFEARRRVVEDLETHQLLEATEARQVEIGHSDRSKTPIEPYLSKQWFVRTEDIEGGIVCGRGTEKEFVTPGLAQAAMDAVQGKWRSATGRRVEFHPERYASTYLSWLSEKRDWCISRQLWWGHRISIWSSTLDKAALSQALAYIEPLLDEETVCARVVLHDGSSQRVTTQAKPGDFGEGDEFELQVCLRDPDSEPAALQLAGLERDRDVLDTWFSSALWPHSTLGWPDPETAQVDPGQTPLASQGEHADCLDYYYPGSCLVTGRDIITLWVARMLMAGLYNLGDVPFTDVFIHANILDGKGERMSKSKGNGIDPVDIIKRYGADAMRYVLCEMQTGTQDIRLPVQAISPFSGNLVDLATAEHGKSIFTYLCPETHKEFDVLGTMPEVPAAKLISERFEVGRNFCNKLWNAARFTLMNLEGAHFTARTLTDLATEDRWILSRLSRTGAAIQRQLEEYNPAAAISLAREFFWSELCDWYLELIKPRLRESSQRAVAQQVLAVAMDQVLRLMHPFIPLITEALWSRLNQLSPERGIDVQLPGSEQLMKAAWPEPRPDWQDPPLEEGVEFLQGTIRSIRDLRSSYTVPPKESVSCRIRASGHSAEVLSSLSGLLSHMANLESLQISASEERSRDSAATVFRDVEIFLPGVLDLDQERTRLTKHCNQVRTQIEGKQKKLSNENFVKRAKPEVVERERTRLAELEEQLESILRNLKALDG